MKSDDPHTCNFMLKNMHSIGNNRIMRTFVNIKISNTVEICLGCSTYLVGFLIT